jgi:uncharacterized membrane protein YfcA
MFATELALALTIATVIFVAALISSIAGFAFSALGGAALVYLLQDPVRTVAILTVCSIAIHGYCTWRVRRDIEWRMLAPFLVGGAVTVPLGVWLLTCVPASVFAAGLGAFLVAYGSYTILCRRVLVVRQSPARDATAGGLGGLLAGLAGLGGAAVTAWCGLRGWSKERQRALCQPFILFMQVEALALVGTARPAALPAETFYLYLPVALAAACTGVGLLQRMSTAHFNLVVRLLLVVSGAALLGPVLSRLGAA